MSVLGQGAGSGYPGAIDTKLTYANAAGEIADSSSRMDAEVLNDILIALVAIQTELGVNPSGSLVDVATRVAKIITAAGALQAAGDLDMNDKNILAARNYYPTPGGRLTLATGTPIMVAEVANATTLYYTPCHHDLVPLYDGAKWTVYRFTELSIAMAASANWAANSNFDVYIYNDGGTLRLVTGAAWTSDTARNESLTRLNGRWTNTASMTGRYGAASTVTVPANQGLYVGTIRTTASTGTTTWELGGAAANGDPGFLYVWNMYNRVPVSISVHDNTNSWTYQSATLRSKNASTGNRVTYVCGQPDDVVSVLIFGRVVTSATPDTGFSTVALDATNANHATLMVNTWNDATPSVSQGNSAVYQGYPGVGAHFFQATEACVSATAAVTFQGDNNLTTIKTGLQFSGSF